MELYIAVSTYEPPPCVQGKPGHAFSLRSHPRVYGENVILTVGEGAPVEPSPRVRGKPTGFD